ncbi:MAG TPA: DUF4282 domain-containing protein [Planctomycetota bacterium]|nr:DUF4282 domain-containing protein [Planctomycetota bacterium]
MDMDLKKVDRNRMVAFFKFDLLILPTLVKIVFILGVVGLFLMCLWLPFRMASGFSFGPDGIRSEFNCGTFAVGLIVSGIFFVLGMLWWRVVCESMIILFKIHEVLAGRKEGAPPASPAAGTPPSPPPQA